MTSLLQENEMRTSAYRHVLTVDAVSLCQELSSLFSSVFEVI
jgi:hypothetical protein